MNKESELVFGFKTLGSWIETYCKDRERVNKERDRIIEERPYMDKEDALVRALEKVTDRNYKN